MRGDASLGRERDHHGAWEVLGGNIRAVRDLEIHKGGWMSKDVGGEDPGELEKGGEGEGGGGVPWRGELWFIFPAYVGHISVYSTYFGYNIHSYCHNE